MVGSMMTKKILFTLLLFISAVNTYATHIVGGSMFYEHLGGSSYSLSIRLYKDCSPNSINFSTSLRVEIRNGDGSMPSTSFVRIPLLARDTLAPHIDTCAFNPGVCVELGVYSKIISLPPQSGGYHLFYTDCCRNGSVVNIVSPLTYGEGLHTYVPDNNLYITNSSPVFSSYPPVYVCKDQDLNFDFSANDADGDSLTYQLIKPYHGKNEYDVAYASLLPTISASTSPPNNITFNTIIYNTGFSSSNPLNAISGNGLTISSTGLLTGVPEAVGQYLVGVRVDEYRNGVKIGTIVRDFQYNVLDCPPLKDANIGEIDACSGLTIQHQNASGLGANGFWWDFGTGNIGDTSIVAEPTFTYPANGTYQLTLMAQKGTLCADTAYQTITISDLFESFSGPDTLCVGEIGFFTNTSTVSANANIIGTQWDFGDNTNEIGNSVTHSYSQAGDYNVRFIVNSDVGCEDTLFKNVHVKTAPQPNFSPTISCNDLTVNFVNNTVGVSNDFHWDFGTAALGDSSIMENPTYTFPTTGTYPIRLISESGTACADTITKNLKIHFVQSGFSVPDTICENTIVQFTNQSTASNTTINSWVWNFGNNSTSTQQNPFQGYSTIGTYNVSLITNSTSGCGDTIVKQIVVADLPTVQFAPDNLCQGLTVSFSNLSDPTAFGFNWNFGTGDPNDASSIENPTFTFPSYGTYNVSLTANPGSACNVSYSLPVTLSNVTADFTAADTACVNEAIAFTDQSTGSNSIVQWHWNFDDFSSSVAQNNFHEFAAGGTYDVQLVAYASDGCTDTIQKTIQIMSMPIANGGADTAQCAENAAINLSGTVSFAGGLLWTGNGGQFSPDSTSSNITYTPSPNELSNGSTYLLLTTTDSYYCPASTDSVLIDYVELPFIQLNDNDTLCTSEPFYTINATVNNALGTIWSTNGTGTFVNQNIANTDYSPSAADINNGFVQLYLNSINPYACQNSGDTLTLYFSPVPTVDISYSDTACFLGQIELNSNASTNNGVWETFGDGSFIPSDTGAVVTYQLGLIDSELGQVKIAFQTLNNYGCEASLDTITFKVIKNPEIDFSTVISCIGSPTIIQDETSYLEPILNWNWTIDNNTYSGDLIQHLFPTVGYHDVTLEIESLNGCKDSVTIPIKVNALPIPDFYAPEPCIYGAVFVDSSHADSTTIDDWSWEFGDGGVSFVQNPTHKYDSTDTYSVTLTVTSGFGCVDSITKNINIYPAPNALFKYFPDPAKVGELVKFTSNSYSVNAPIIAWDWDFMNGEFSNEINPSTVYEKGGIYNVMLVVFDDVGCRDTVINPVFIAHGPKIPTAFSPNGDGLNDFLNILGTGFKEINFTIYNNWGGVIYHTEDINDKGWDGTYQGKDQPIGVYVYTAIVVNIYGDVIEISGDVTLVR